MSLFHQQIPSTIVSLPTQVVAVQLCVGFGPSVTSTEVWAFESKINLFPIAMGCTIEIFRNREDAFAPGGNQRWLVSGTIVGIVGCYKGQMILLLQEGAWSDQHHTLLAIPALLTTVAWSLPQRWWHSVTKPSIKPLLMAINHLCKPSRHQPRRCKPWNSTGTSLEFSCSVSVVSTWSTLGNTPGSQVPSLTSFDSTHGV
jgi:hypothetical protein